MAGNNGPKIVTSGLILALDAADRKSCVGPPTINLLTYSNALNNGIWSGFCGPTSNITFNTTDITDPIGTNTAAKIARNNVANCGGVGNVAWGLLYYPGANIIESGKTYTVSVYARGASGGETFIFGLNDSYVTTVTLTTTWTRYSYTFSNITISGNTAQDRGFEFYNNTATSQVFYVWGPQTQLGTSLGPYVASGATNGTSNLTWNDLSGRNNNTTLTNGPTYDNNNLGSIVFDGTNDYASSSITTTTLSPSSDFSIMCWAYINTSIGTTQVLAYLGNFITYTPYYNWIGLAFNATTMYVGNYVNPTDYSLTFTIPSSGWYQVAQIRNGANHYGYLNGLQKASGTYTNPSINASSTLRIGSTITNGDYLNGKIASVQIYNRALSGSEVLQNFNAARGRFGI